MSRVLITGATGFVGGQILAAGRAQNIPMRLVLRPGWQAKTGPLPPDCEVVETGDLFAESKEWWQQTCEGIDTIIHSAWYTEHGKYLTSPRNTDCLIGTLRMAQGAALAKVRRFVGVGTCIEYQLGDQILTPDTPLAPTTVYGQAKAAAFFALSGFFHTSGGEFLWCRIFQPYGEGENPQRLYPYVHSCLSQGKPVDLGSGKQVRDFIDVKEAGANILTHALGKRQGAINICSGVPRSIRDFVTAIAESYGRSDLLRFGARDDNPKDWDYIVGAVGQDQ